MILVNGGHQGEVAILAIGQQKSMISALDSMQGNVLTVHAASLIIDAGYVTDMVMAHTIAEEPVNGTIMITTQVKNMIIRIGTAMIEMTKEKVVDQ